MFLSGRWTSLRFFDIEEIFSDMELSFANSFLLVYEQIK